MFNPKGIPAEDKVKILKGLLLVNAGAVLLTSFTVQQLEIERKKLVRKYRELYQLTDILLDNVDESDPVLMAKLNEYAAWRVIIQNMKDPEDK